MSKRRRTTNGGGGGSPGPSHPGRSSGRDGEATSARVGASARPRSWFEANRSDLKFLAIFGSCLVVYYLLTLTPPVKDGLFPSYLRLNARVSVTILSAFGDEVTAEGRSIVSARGPAIELERGCDAVEPSALFVSAVMASPVRLWSRLAAAGLGTVLLMLLNLVRIITLYLVRVHHPSLFETMHLDVWQALFILFALLLWAVWASRAARTRSAEPDASP